MSDKSKAIIQTKSNTLALHGHHPVKTFNCWETFNDCSRESNRKRGQDSSWTVAPEEEDVDDGEEMFKLIVGNKENIELCLQWTALDTAYLTIS
jgi:hypothetical protein